MLYASHDQDSWIRNRRCLSSEYSKRGDGWRGLKEDFGGVWGLVKSSEMHFYDYTITYCTYINTWLEVGVQRSSVVSTLDCWCPVPDSILTQSLMISSPGFYSHPVTSPEPPPPPPVQELPLSEVGPSPEWQPGWILYYKISIKSGKNTSLLNW